MRTSLLILLLLLVGVAVPFWWSPYSASGRIALALADHDEAVLSQAVDVERLQRIVAHNVRTSHVVQRNATLDPRFQRAFEELIQQTMQEEVQRRTNRMEIWRLLQDALGRDLQGTRFERSVQLLRRGELEWRDLNSVYVGRPGAVRLLLRRSGVIWRVAAMQFPEPKVQLELRMSTSPPH